MRRCIRGLARAAAVALVVAVASSPGARADSGSDGRVAIAVSYFANTADARDLAPLRKALADMLITDLAVSTELRVVERARLQAVLDELALQKQPYIDKATAVKLGRGLGAAYIVTGAYLVRDGTLRIDVRAVDVETGEVAFATSAQGALDQLFEVQRELGADILARLGARLTLLQRKQLGAQGTRSYPALAAYGDALDARDRGDEAAEKAALARALAADPRFQKVARRLAALERRVEALEQSGGRIMRPTTARQFFHNARIQKAEGDYKGARDGLARAAALEPALCDVWLLAAEISPGAPFALDALARAPGLRPLVEALFAGDAGALDAALRGRRGPHTLHAAAFSFALIRDLLPAKAMRTYERAHRAVRELLAAEADGRLARAFIDHLPLVSAARAADSRYFRADRVGQLDTAAQVALVDDSQQHRDAAWWRVRVSLRERATSPVTLRIERDLSHPHWSEKPPPRGKHRFWYAYLRDRGKWDAVKRAIETPGMLIYSFEDWNAGIDRPGVTVGIAKQGADITIPAASLRCGDDDRQLTGGHCTADVWVFKVGVEPGRYRATVRYQDVDRAPIERVVEAWAMEMSLVWHHTIHYPGRKRLVTFLIPRDAAERKQRLVGARALDPASEVLVHGYYWGSHKGGGDVAHLHYDVDYGLLGGERPDSPREWMRYRDRILRKGYKLPSTGMQTYLPLPALLDGEHWLCLATVRQNGSRTPEAECLRVEISAPR